MGKLKYRKAPKCHIGGGLGRMDVGFARTEMPAQTVVLLKKSGKSISARRLRGENHPITIDDVSSY